MGELKICVHYQLLMIVCVTLLFPIKFGCLAQNAQITNFDSVAYDDNSDLFADEIVDDSQDNFVETVQQQSNEQARKVYVDDNGRLLRTVDGESASDADLFSDDDLPPPTTTTTRTHHDGDGIEGDESTTKIYEDPNSTPTSADGIEIIDLVQSGTAASQSSSFSRDPLNGYHWESLIIVSSIAYVVLYIRGRLRNDQITKQWVEACKPILNSEFSLVGCRVAATSNHQHGCSSIDIPQIRATKENDATYRLWCSGRRNLNGLLIKLKLKPRFCALQTALTAAHRSTAADICTYTFDVRRDQMDSFVLLVGCDKSIPRSYYSKRINDFADLGNFCVERKPRDNTLSYVFTELNEPIDMLANDSRLRSIILKNLLRLIHISDCYGGADWYSSPSSIDTDTIDSTHSSKTNDHADDKDTPARCVIYLEFNIKHDSSTFEDDYRNCLNFALYLVDKICCFRLTRDAKTKAIKNRQIADEKAQKAILKQKQEVAKQKREEKRKILLSSTDPDELHKVEEKRNKRELRKRQQCKTMLIRSG